MSTGPFDAYPAWSPDGNRLIWWRLDEFGYTLWVANADGSNGHELIPGYRTFGPSPPQWSVAGLIGFSVGVPGRSVPGGEQFDVVTTPAGVGPRALTRTRFVDEQFEDWSPDGRAMTITRYDESGLGQIWLTSSDAPFVRTLLAEPDEWNGSAVFSPDGEKLAFITSSPQVEQSLAVMNSDGTGRTIIATPGLQPAGLTWQPRH